MPEAIVLLDTTHRKEKDLIKEFKKLDHISECNVVYGDYDVLIRIEADDFKQIREVIKKVRSYPDVNLTQTFVYSEANKFTGERRGKEIWDSEKLD